MCTNTHKHRVLAICNSVATVPDDEGDKIGEVRYEHTYVYTHTHIHAYIYTHT